MSAPWQLTVGGRTYVGRPVSAAQVRAYAEAHQAAEGQPDQRARQAAAVVTLLRAAFPERLSMLWRGDPVRLLMRASPAEIDEALTSFFRHRGLLPSPR